MALFQFIYVVFPKNIVCCVVYLLYSENSIRRVLFMFLYLEYVYRKNV